MTGVSEDDKIPEKVLKDIARKVRRKAIRHKTRIAIMEGTQIILIDPLTNKREIVDADSSMEI